MCAKESWDPIHLGHQRNLNSRTLDWYAGTLAHWVIEHTPTQMNKINTLYVTVGPDSQKSLKFKCAGDLNGPAVFSLYKSEECWFPTRCKALKAALVLP